MTLGLQFVVQLPPAYISLDPTVIPRASIVIKIVRFMVCLEAKAGLPHPIRWACAQPLNADGSMTIQLKSINDKDWRKGI